MMNLHNKILPVALVAALLGGSVGALVMRKGDQPETRVASANLLPTSQPVNASRADALRFNDAVAANNAQDTVAVNSSDANGVNFQNSAEETAYREGFADGFEAGRNERASTTVTRSAAPSRVVYRNNAPARRVRSSRASRTAYYDYQQPRKRSFWQKHRDKLTVAMGAGGGALIGGLVGGKKGALIGAGAGGGGAALYTYGLRKRNRRN